MHLLRGLFLLWLTAGFVGAQFELPTTLGRPRAVKARLVLSHETARPGETILAGVELTMSPGWHTYWRNGGDSGAATEIHWAQTVGISPGDIQWPVPEKLVERSLGDLTTYIYHDRAVLLVPLQIAPDAAAGTQELSALVKWLECKESCLPGSNLVRATLTIGPASKPGGDAALFAEAQQRLPSPTVPGTVSAQWEQGAAVTNRTFTIDWKTAASDPDFFPYTNAIALLSPKVNVIANTGSNVILRASAERTEAAWPQKIAGLLVRQENGALAGYEVSLPLADTGPGFSAVTAAGGAVGATKSIWGWLLYAFIGGLILNIMPCVLPVIALKILGFVSQSREAPGRVRTLGLLYTLGVIFSFLVLAGLVIGVKAAGQKAGWGMQFSNPQFIIILTVIVTLVALNLFGVFEITLGGSAMNAASGAAHRHGSAGAFMNGVLATVLATPCTAPFLGAALGFAFAQPAHIIALFFVTIGLGLALPYLLLSWNPAWLKFLPKPGAWMERFKVAMGFPMLATALWLLSLTTTFYGERSWWVGVFLVFVGAAAWIFGTFVQHGRSRRGLATGIAAAVLVAGYAWALDGELRWRSPDRNVGGAQPVPHAPTGYAWQRWSAGAVAQARAEGRPVVVDFTAKWCLTCNISVKPAFESQAVIAKLKSINAVALVADYTLYPTDISQELERFGRSGVPLVLVYPSDASKPPIILPEPLPYPAPYGPRLLEALAKVAP